MERQTLNDYLKPDAEKAKFKIVGDYLVFDKSSDLSFQAIPHFTLKELLTKNPVSHTELNLNLLAKVDTLRENFGHKLTVRTSYQSPEYHLLSFGAMDSDRYQYGDAISLACESQYLDKLAEHANSLFPTGNGEVGIYPWGVHLAWTKTGLRWDKRNDNSAKQKFKNFISNDIMKNVILIGGVAAAVYFFFIRKK